MKAVKISLQSLCRFSPCEHVSLPPGSQDAVIGNRRIYNSDRDNLRSPTHSASISRLTILSLLQLFVIALSVSLLFPPCPSCLSPPTPVSSDDNCNANLSKLISSWMKGKVQQGLSFGISRSHLVRIHCNKLGFLAQEGNITVQHKLWCKARQTALNTNLQTYIFISHESQLLRSQEGPTNQLKEIHLTLKHDVYKDGRQDSSWEVKPNRSIIMNCLYDTCSTRSPWDTIINRNLFPWQGWVFLFLTTGSRDFYCL